jgi:signal transduction histidine kinase
VFSAHLLLALDPLVISALVILMAGALFVPVRRSYRRRLEAGMRAQERLAMARVLHRVRNPLQTILLDADLLLDERTSADPDVRRELCEAILAEAMRMSEMLSELSPEPMQSLPTLPEPR